MTSNTGRIADHPIDPAFTNRWSPRAFTGESMPEADLLTILEAARWAPSANNSQPWRFIWGLKGTPEFDAIAAVLMGFNQVWAPQASALLVAVSKTHSVAPGQTEAKYARWHAHDTGAATLALALQANTLGYHAHVMGGIEGDQAKQAFGIPQEGWEVQTGIAIGKIGARDSLPEKLQEREVPSPRMPLSAIAFNGRFEA